MLRFRGLVGALIAGMAIAAPTQRAVPAIDVDPFVTSVTAAIRSVFGCHGADAVRIFHSSGGGSAGSDGPPEQPVLLYIDCGSTGLRRAYLELRVRDRGGDDSRVMPADLEKMDLVYRATHLPRRHALAPAVSPLRSIAGHPLVQRLMAEIAPHYAGGCDLSEWPAASPAGPDFKAAFASFACRRSAEAACHDRFAFSGRLFPDHDYVELRSMSRGVICR